MMQAWAALVLVMGCPAVDGVVALPGSGEVPPPDDDTSRDPLDSDGSDDDTDISDDTDTDDDTDTSDDTDTDDTEDTETEPPPEPDTSVWNATRRFRYDGYWSDCDETVIETGVTIPATSELTEACPSCDLFYEVSIDRDIVCDWVPLKNPTWRGLDLRDRSATVYTIDLDGWQVEAEPLDESASFDGFVIEYGLVSDYGSVELEITGVVTFPPL